MSLKLYGMPLSNYYNMVKTILIEKGMDFEEVLVKPNQEAGLKCRGGRLRQHQSQSGKSPCSRSAQTA